MIKKYSTIKNYTKSKTFYNRNPRLQTHESQEIRMKTMYNQSQKLENSCQEDEEVAAEDQGSNFKQLKKQIKNLENSQFLSLKYNSPSEMNSVEQAYEFPQFRITGKQFMSTKKVNDLQRIKLCLKKRVKSRKLNCLLDIKGILNRTSDEANYHCLNTFTLKCFQPQPLKQNFLKRRYVPNYIKKMQKKDELNKSLSQFRGSSNEIRGRRVLSSKSSAPEKQNILICCY